MKKILNNKKGFTLMELVIVIAILAILAAVTIPAFANVSKQANISAAKAEARNHYMIQVVEILEKAAVDGTDANYSNVIGTGTSGNVTYTFDGTHLKETTP